MENTAKIIEVKVNVLFVFRHRIDYCLEIRQKTNKDEKLVKLWDKVRNLEDDYLNEKLEEFAQKIGTHTLDVWELEYVAQKILDELLEE